MPTLLFAIPAGIVFGFLLNYLADVLPITRSVLRPACPVCGSSQPILGQMFALRFYPTCGHRRPLRFWLVMAISLALTIWSFTAPPARLGTGYSLILFFYFSLVAVIDIEHRLILHPVSLAGILVALPFGLLRHGWLNTLLGGLAGFGLMFVFYGVGVFYARWAQRKRGLSEDEVALGFGDVNLAGVLGLLLGWPGITAGLVIALLLGGAASLLYLLGMLLARRYHAFAAIPYGPFLLLGALILLLR